MAQPYAVLTNGERIPISGFSVTVDGETRNYYDRVYTFKDTGKLAKVDAIAFQESLRVVRQASKPGKDGKMKHTVIWQDLVSEEILSSIEKGVFVGNGK